MTTALASHARAHGKSPEAFRTISEVSSALDVPQHVLRFWETRFAQVRPVKRAGGRRFYRPDDVALLRGIRALLYTDGYTIKGVQKVLRAKGWRFVADIGRNAGDAVPWEEIGDLGEVEQAAPLPVVGGQEIAPGANAAIAALMNAHADVDDDVGEKITLDEHKRVRLELLLAELLVMRDRVRSARAKA